jgi:hypothetical protein
VLWTDLVGMAGDERPAGVVDGPELPITIVTDLRTAWRVLKAYTPITNDVLRLTNVIMLYRKLSCPSNEASCGVESSSTICLTCRGPIMAIYWRMERLCW